MFDKKKPEKVFKKIDKSGDWLDYVNIQIKDYSFEFESSLLNEYFKRHPDAVPAFGAGKSFGMHRKYWFLRHGEGLSYDDEEEDIRESIYE